YDMALGRLLTRGCDVWLNNPILPLEACGTSGMKAALNGVLNLSIPDGWWAEAFEHGVTRWGRGPRGPAGRGAGRGSPPSIRRDRGGAGVGGQRALAGAHAGEPQDGRDPLHLRPHGDRLLRAALRGDTGGRGRRARGGCAARPSRGSGPLGLELADLSEVVPRV